jgi:hypothetical protein
VLLILSALIVAGALVWIGIQISGELRAARADAVRARSLELMTWLTPALAAAAADPRAILVWQPLAASARKMFPAEFAEIDRAAGATFPFSPEQLQAAHDRWTTDWLTWERTHDAEFKLKAAAAEIELAHREARRCARAARAIGKQLGNISGATRAVRAAKGLQALITLNGVYKPDVGHEARNTKISGA